jgi:hypothetical protein
MQILALLFCLIAYSSVSFGRDPVVGREAAAKYFQSDVEVDSKTARKVASDGEVGEYVLMLHIGSYVKTAAYEWVGSGRRNDVGKATYGVTYLTDQWGALDVALRLDFTEYTVADSRAQKLSFLPMFLFPLSESRFPFYFGLGAGLGVFFKQVAGESDLSFDYQLVTGVRFMDLNESNAGFFVEFGMKNHVHLLSSGQVNGTALSAGAVWSF